MCPYKINVVFKEFTLLILQFCIIYGKITAQCALEGASSEC